MDGFDTLRSKKTSQLPSIPGILRVMCRCLICALAYCSYARKGRFTTEADTDHGFLTDLATAYETVLGSKTSFRRRVCVVAVLYILLFIEE